MKKQIGKAKMSEEEKLTLQPFQRILLEALKETNSGRRYINMPRRTGKKTMEKMVIAARQNGKTKKQVIFDELVNKSQKNPVKLADLHLSKIYIAVRNALIFMSRNKQRISNTGE
jgi:hypothetical protein